jgi:DNA primase
VQYRGNCFDGDRAGAAAWKALEVPTVISEGHLLRSASRKHDPDSLVQEEGREAFETRISQATPLSAYLVSEFVMR